MVLKKYQVNNKIVILDENQDPVAMLSDIDRDNIKSFPQQRSALELIQGGGLIIDKAAYNVYLNGNKISFPKKEFELLLLLASNPRKVFKRDEILGKIWSKDYSAKDSRSLDVHIRMLRKKLGDHFITTLRGVGYKLEK